jgi:hypothetical protein
MKLNERILQIFPEKGAVKSWSGGDRWGAGHAVHFYSNDQVCRLVERVVRECAAMAGTAEYSAYWDGPIEDRIKQHFGIDNESTNQRTN